MPTIPSCPVTGLPARRRIQPISARLISRLWRVSFGVQTDRQFAGVGHFELWESPCGLAFFEPMLAGDEAFYVDLYRRRDFNRALRAPGLARAEFRRVAELVRPGEKVLDVGCGEGNLARHLRQTSYVGIDPHHYATAADPDVRSETVASTLHGMPSNMISSARSMPSSMSPTRWGSPVILYNASDAAGVFALSCRAARRRSPKFQISCSMRRRIILAGGTKELCGHWRAGSS
jgi:methionine biosynthesis protein MetW